MVELRNFGDFEVWFDKQVNADPLVAKSNPVSLNEVCYILRKTGLDFSVSWRTDTGFKCVPSVREALIPTRDLAKKVKLLGFEPVDAEDNDDDTFMGYIEVEVVPEMLTIPRFEPGQEVWIVERDEDGEAHEVGGYAFLAEVAGYAILSPYVNDHGDLEYLLDYHRRDTCMDYDADLPVVYLDDCYPSQMAAHHALDEEVGENDC